MAADETIRVEAIMDDQTEAGTESAKENVGSLFQTFVDFKAAFDLVSAAAGKFFDFMKQGIEVAKVQENAQAHLTATLQANGIATRENLQAVLDMSSALQQQIGVGDEVLIQQSSQAIALGANVDQLEAMIRASAGAGAAGKNQEEIMRALALSTQGVLGPLGELLPATRNLSMAQLRAGEAIDMVNDAFGSLAEGGMATFEGRLTLVNNTLGDTAEEFGFFVTKSNVLNASLIELNEVLIEINGSVNDQQESMTSLTDQVVTGLTTAVQFLVFSWDKLNEVYLKSASFLASWRETFLNAIEGALEAFRIFSEAVSGRFAKMIGLGDEFNDGWDRTITIFSELSDSFAEDSSVMEERLRIQREETIENQAAFEMYKLEVRQTAAEIAAASENIEDMNGKMRDTPQSLDQIEERVNRFWENYGEGFDGAFGTFNEWARAIEDSEAFEGFSEKQLDLIDRIELEWRHGIDRFAEEAEDALLTLEDFGFSSVDMISAMTSNTLGTLVSGMSDAFSDLMLVQAGLADATEVSFEKMAAAAGSSILSVVSQILTAAATTIIAKGIEAAANQVAGYSQQQPPWLGLALGLAAAGTVAGIFAGFLGKLPKAASGGEVVGPGPKGQDSVLAMLAPGELIVPSSIVDGLRETFGRRVGGGQGFGVTQPRIPAAANGGVVHGGGVPMGSLNVTIQSLVPPSPSWMRSNAKQHIAGPLEDVMMRRMGRIR